MEAFGDEDLEILLVEAKWNNREAIRLFENEREFMLKNKSSQFLNSNSGRENSGWITSHLHEIDRNLCEVDDKFLKWKTLGEAVKKACTESVILKGLQFDEMRRTASLYYSLGESIAAQQSQEFQLRDLTSKFRTLQKQQIDVLLRKNETEKTLTSTKIKYSDLLREKEDMKSNKAKIVSLEGDKGIKRQRIADQNIIDGARSSSTPHTKYDKDVFAFGDCHGGRFEMPKSNCANSSTNTKSVILIKEKPMTYDFKKDFVVRDKGDDSKESFLGRRIRKNFPSHGYYNGTIQEFKRPYFTIIYDDGDKEEITLSEIMKWIVS